jgi:hypothetical protein
MMEKREPDLNPETMKRMERTLHAAADFTPEREMPADLIERALLRRRRACRPFLPRRAALAAALGLLALMLASAFRGRAPESVQVAGHHAPAPVIPERKAPDYLLPEPSPSNPSGIVPVKSAVQPVPPRPGRENAVRRRSSAKPAPRREIRRRVRPAEPYRPQRIYAAHPTDPVQAVLWQEEVVKVPSSRVFTPGWIVQPDPQQQAVYITPAVAEFSLSNE